MSAPALTDLNIGAVVLVGDHNWRKGPRLHVLCARLFGRTARFEHLGLKVKIKWWREKPYLVHACEGEGA